MTIDHQCECSPETGICQLYGITTGKTGQASKLLQICRGECKEGWREFYREKWLAHKNGQPAQPSPARIGPCHYLGNKTGRAVVCDPCGGTERDEFHCSHAEYGPFTTIPNCQGSCKGWKKRERPEAIPTDQPVCEVKETTMPNNCSDARPDMTREAMLACIAANPPGPWPNGWAEWDVTQAAIMELIARRKAELLALPGPPMAPVGGWRGRGIIICGGGPKYLPGLWVAIRRIRGQGCQVPIQVWHLGTKEYCPMVVRATAAMGVEWVDMRAMEVFHPARILCGWEAKTYAALYSSFEEVLLLDADNAPAGNATRFFDEPGYQKHGATFWPDYGHWDLKPGQWEKFGLAFRAEPAFESGQLIVDKGRAWRALAMAMFIAEYSDYSFKHVYGDKEAFHLGWRIMDAEYGMPTARPAWLGGCTIGQYDESGQPAFWHRCQDKWRYDGGHALVNYEGEQDALADLAELRKIWDGRLWSNTAYTPAETTMRSELVGKRFMYERCPWPPANFWGDKRPITLKADGYVGEGAAGREHLWEIHDWGGQLCLCISGTDGLPTMKLARQVDGTFRGKWLDFERMPVELRPCA